MIINNIRLENFKCFLDVKISFKQLTFLVGLNSVGKSSVIQSILLPLQSSHETSIEINGDLVNLGAYDDILNINASDDSVRISIELDKGEFSWGYPVGYINDVRQQRELPLLNGDTHNMNSLKNNFQYISAERWGPRDNVPILHKYRKGWLGKNGEHVIDYLYSLTNESASENNLNLAKDDPRIHNEAKNSTILSSIESWMGEISPGVSFDMNVYREANIGWSSFTYEGDSKKFRAGNIGFGISYSLSIVSALISAEVGDLIIIENPEAHIHPRGQSQLGQLLALTSSAGVQVIVETHSEHIINGARVAIRVKKVDHQNVFIYYFNKNKALKAPEIIRIESDKRANLNNWPEGFFDQTVVDMETIIKG